MPKGSQVTDPGQQIDADRRDLGKFPSSQTRFPGLHNAPPD